LLFVVLYIINSLFVPERQVIKYCFSICGKIFEFQVIVFPLWKLPKSHKSYVPFCETRVISPIVKSLVILMQNCLLLAYFLKINVNLMFNNKKKKTIDESKCHNKKIND
jgi:hypothetical protein